MTEISLGAAPGVTCSIAAGETINATPSWNILEVNAGPGIDGCLPDEDVTGCSDPLHFGDQMLFGAITLRLRSVRLKVPELNANLDLARRWSQAPVLAGLPKLSAPAVFELPKAIARVFDPHADVLLSLSIDSEPIEPMRLSVTEDLDLLFAEGAHVGCMLRFASRHLVSPLTGRAPIRTVATDPASTANLAEFFRLVDDDFVAALQDQDIAARTAIEHFRGRARQASDGVNEILASWIDDMLERLWPR